MATSVLAIDQGTTGTTGMVTDVHGQTRTVAMLEHKQFYPQPGWVEHDPEELMTNIWSCIEAGGDVSAIGIDNQGESCLAWRADTKEALTPVIVWQDDRTRKSINNLKSDGLESEISTKTGLPLNSYFSASKLAWIVRNAAHAKEHLATGNLRLGNTDAFFLDRLTGHFATDITTASRTSLMDLETGQWDASLCDVFGVPIDTLPEIRSTTGKFGAVSFGGKQIPVTANIVDQQASLYGHNCRSCGDAKVTFGTGAFALTVTGEQVFRSPETGLVPTVAWQLEDSAPMYALDGAVFTAGAAINWVRGLGLFNEFSEINSFDLPPAIERNLAFVPALNGLACPHWDRSAAGLWIGLTLDTSARDMVQAVLEGIAFRASEVLWAMESHIFTDNTNQPRALSIDGGVAANPYFCQFLSNILGYTVRVPHLREMTSLGTAMLAMRGTGDGNLPVCDQVATAYTPTPLSAGFREKFSEAIELSKNWQNI